MWLAVTDKLLYLVILYARGLSQLTLRYNKLLYYKCYDSGG